MARPIKDIAKGRWRGILRDIGVGESFLTGKHGPCPLCDGKDRWRFTDWQGAGGWVCNQCGRGDGVKLVEQFLHCDFKEATRRIEEAAGEVKPEPPKAERSQEDITASMRALWMASHPITRNDPAWTYLNRRTGLTEFCRDLRAIDKLRYAGPPKMEMPGLIAIVRGADGQACQIHRTYLTWDGAKAGVEKPKQLMKAPVPQGCAIRLADQAEEMGIAEGNETALSAGVMFQMPVWSAISAGNMVRWNPPEGVRRVHIFGDNDASFAGQHAAYGLASVLWIRKFEVVMHLPPDAGTDWNDVHADELSRQGDANSLDATKPNGAAA